MYQPSLQEFLKLSRQGNVIPVYKEINADLDTPVSAFLKIPKGDYAFLLESVEGQEKVARYSFLGSNPSLIFKAKGRNIEIISSLSKKPKRYTTDKDPLYELAYIMRGFKPVMLRSLPRFCGGFVGYTGYDMVRFLENIPDKNPDDLKMPDMVFLLTETILVFDHVNHVIKIVSNVMLPSGIVSLAKKKELYRRAVSNIDKIEKNFAKPLELAKEKKNNFPTQKVGSNLGKEEFEDSVRRAKEFIRKGDIIQVVLSQRFNVHTGKRPFDIYRSLRSLNPSPYMFFLRLNDLNVIGASPEMLVRCENGFVQTRPIAGTRPRGLTEEKDNALAEELLNDKKERAEHIMLVDLGRNDLGRVCKPGKVKVTNFMSVERYSHVMHLVSEVSGELKNKLNSFDVLRACFPAGTVSGSPKIRAMEIIDELENTRRGTYAGCVGYFSFSGNMDTCITIRTIVMKGHVAYIQAGAGIVADSVPAREYLESVNKARALIEAIKD